MTKQVFYRLYLAFALCLLGGLSQAVQAHEIPFTARLVWGTDEAKPEDPKLKPLNETLTGKFKGIFKWKNYFEVSEQSFAVADPGTRKTKMSPKCEVEVENLGKDSVEVRLFGEGKFIKKVKKTIQPGEVLVIAGDDKNDTAWFVILTREMGK